jgi:hypothetical protein
MKYISRSVKYLIKLALLLTILFVFMIWSDTSTLTGDNWQSFFASYFATWKGWLFTAAVIVWCAIYPRVEFVTRHLNYDMHDHKLAIIKALDAGRMMLSEETDNRMVFHAESPARKLWWMGDDAVTITRTGTGGFDLEGPRRFVMEAEHRIPAYIDREL